MVRTKWGYVWIAGVVRALEIRYGPFWEPSRARAAVDPEAILRNGDALEILLLRLAHGRAKSFAIAVGSAVILGATILMTPLLSRLGFAWLGPALTGTLGGVIAWVGHSCWRTWWWVVYGTNTLPPSSPAPDPHELIGAMRQMCDDLAVVGHGPAAAALGEMRVRSPLTYRLCMNTTVADSIVKHRVSAA